MKRIALMMIVAVVILPILAVSTLAQAYNGQTNLGLYLGGNVNMHQISASPVSNGTANPNVLFDKNATSLFLNGGFIANFPVSDLITISGRLGYNGFRGSFEADGDKLETKLDYFEINPNVQFHNLISNSPLYFMLGVELGVPMNAQYNYFTAGTKTSSNVDIDDKNFRLAAALGVGYVFDLGKSVYLTPEASFRLPFTKVSASDAWDSYTVPQLRIGLALTFGLGGDKKPEVVDVPGVELEVGFKDVRYYDKQMTTNPLKKITVEETQYAELFPLLPYVFFKENTATVNESTNLSGKRQTGEFSLNELPADAMIINHQVLDVVAARMLENKAARITLNGTLDNQNEKDTRLSQERADFAKKYLVDNYSIDPSRIVTTAGKLPSKASTIRVAEGVEENRRVEIITTNNDLLAPIMITSDKQRIADPDLVEFVAYAKSNEAIKDWELEIKQSGKTVRKFTGKGEPEPIKWSITPNELSASQVPMDYTFTARTISGASKYATASVPVEYFSFTRKKAEEKPDRTISKFSLMLFDFDSPNISDADKNIIEKHILPTIKFNSTVQIYGYTDKIGDDNYNKKLALDRANNVRTYLESKIKNAKYETYGVGESELIFDNNNPVGRHLSRTVQIYVSTPKN